MRAVMPQILDATLIPQKRGDDADGVNPRTALAIRTGAP